jgi:hypothetical protein
MMDRKKIFEGNRLIAEHLYGKPRLVLLSIPKGKELLWKTGNSEYDEYTELELSGHGSRCYHDDYKWIMPVVEKIAKELDPSEEFIIQYFEGETYSTITNPEIETVNIDPITSMWETCIKYIKFIKSPIEDEMSSIEENILTEITEDNDCMKLVQSMMTQPMNTIPLKANEYLTYLSKIYGFCGEMMITAYAHYLQAVHGKTCKTNDYKITEEGKKWFKNN